MYDTVSGYDHSLDRFSASWTPRQVKAHAERQAAASKDTLESPKERMERQAPLKASPKNGAVPEEREVVVGRAGKFVFTAIVAPPYYLLFKAPQWIAAAILPNIEALGRLGLENARRLISEISRLFKKAASPVRDVHGKIRWAVAKMMKKNGSLMAFLRQGGQRIFRFAMRPVLWMAERCACFCIKAREKSEKLLKKFMAPLQSLIKRPRWRKKKFNFPMQKMLAPVLSILAKIRGGSNFAAEKALLSFMGKMKFVQDSLNRLFAPIAAWAFGQFIKFEKWSGKKLGKFALFCGRHLLPVVKKMSNAMDFASDKGKKLLWELHLFVQKRLALLSEAGRLAETRGKAVLKSFFHRLSVPLQRLLLKFSFLSAAGEYLMKKGGSLRSRTSLILQKVRAEVERASSYLINAADKIGRPFAKTSEFSHFLIGSLSRKVRYARRYIAAGLREAKMSCK